MPRFPAALALVALAAPAAAQDKPLYVKKPTRTESVVATLKANGLPAPDGKWHYIGPFDNSDGAGFDTAYPPEKEIDLAKKYPGKRGLTVEWKEFADFKLGMNDLDRFPKVRRDACVYLYTEIDNSAPGPVKLPVSLGSDDTLSVWLNGKRLVHEDIIRGAAPDQNHAVLELEPGKNRLLVKVCQAAGEWKFYIAPDLPKSLGGSVLKQLERDFPAAVVTAQSKSDAAAEAAHYRIVTLPLPNDLVLEVGGLGFRPDGKLLACTRRGEVWLIDQPGSDDLTKVKFSRFASGLHEALGMCVEDDNTVFLVQRPELTKLIDKDGNGTADEFVTVCDKWGVSGDYHEFAFGPARDKAGNFYVTLNVGFGGGHQAKAPWRGWCVKVSPKGEMTPVATGLRSPNGVNISPDGALFYCDNQGEWVASNKMHEIREGEFYGHQAGLVWIKNSPFAGKMADKVESGMLYDGQPGVNRNAPPGLPKLTPPCIWFPYGRMGQSVSEPIWDTTGGKFGPFAGQCFVGDQTRSSVMRVALEKVGGRHQGACFPFRSGFQCGINRLAFGPDGGLYAGETNRGWGSLGGKPYGLQRLAYTGVLPFEVHTMSLTKTGFDLTFTKPLDPETANKPAAYAMQSFTYNYYSNYGSPEVDQKAEPVKAAAVSPDRKTVSLAMENLRVGRVYELRLSGVKSADGGALLHPEAYYTLNQLR